MRYFLKVLIVALLIGLFSFSCASDSSDDEPIPITKTPDNPTTPIVPADPADPVDPVVPVSPGEPVVLSNSEFTKIDFLPGVSALAVKERVIDPSRNISGRLMSVSGDSETCDDLGALSEGIYTQIINDGSTPCISGSEYWEDGTGTTIFGKYYIPVDTSSDGKLMSVVPDVKPFITDENGNVYELPGNPRRRTGFKNTRMIKSHNGKPHYINSEGKLVWFDFLTSSEVTVLDKEVTKFSFKVFSDGDHIVFDSSGDVRRIKPDQSEEILVGVAAGQWHDIGGSIQHISGGKFKRLRFDQNGNTIACGGSNEFCISYPVEFQLWIDRMGKDEFGNNIAMPTGIDFGGSLSECDDKAVGDQRIMICNGKAFRAGGVDEDLEDVNWCDFGHCGINSWLTIKSCASSSYVYFYGEDTLGRYRITWIDDLTGQFRDILDTHKITDLECISDSELAVIGDIERDGVLMSETLNITGADTISPTVTVIDSAIKDIITP